MDSWIPRQKGSHHQFHNPRQPQRFPSPQFYRPNLSNQALSNNYEDNYSQSSQCPQLNVQIQEWPPYNPPPSEYGSPSCGSPVPPNIPPVPGIYAPTMYNTPPQVQDGNMIINSQMCAGPYQNFICQVCKNFNYSWKYQDDEKNKIICEKDKEIVELNAKVRRLEEDLKKERRLIKSSESLNNNVDDKKKIERPITHSQLSVHAPEFNYLHANNFQVPVVSANGGLSEETNYTNEEPSSKNENSIHTSDENVNISSEEREGEYIQNNKTDLKNDPKIISTIDLDDIGSSNTTRCQILPKTSPSLDQNKLDNQAEQHLNESEVEDTNNTMGRRHKNTKHLQNNSPLNGKNKPNKNQAGENKQSSNVSRKNSNCSTSSRTETEVRSSGLPQNKSAETSSGLQTENSGKASEQISSDPSKRRRNESENLSSQGYRNSNRWKNEGPIPSTSDNRYDKGQSSSTRDDRNIDSYDKGHKAPKRYPEHEKYPKRPDILKEITGDLFTAPEHFSLAHCVGSDFRMGSGIATTFKQNFKRLPELLEQNAKVGEVAYLEDGNRYIFYIVTKKFSSGKPTFDDFKKALTDLMAKCVQFEVKHLAIPRIGCGLDRLDWKKVRREIIDTFDGVTIEIVVYNFEDGFEEKDYKSIQEKDMKAGQVKDKKRLPSRGPYFNERNQNLVDIEFGTALVFLGTEDGHMDRTAESLNKKFNFITSYKIEKKSVGDVVRIVKNNEVLYSLIVRKQVDDPLSFKVLDICLRKLNKLLHSDEFFYVGFEAFNDPSDDTTMAKIIAMLRFVLSNKLELWLCWPPDVICHEKEQKLQHSWH